MPGTTSMDLVTLVREAIGTTTDAGDRVYMPGDWPAQPGSFPILKLRLVKEDRVSLGRSGPAQFTTTAHIVIAGEVSAPAQTDNQGAVVAESALWRLKRQVEVAVINSMPLSASIQQISAMRSQLTFDGSGATHVAGVQMDLALEFYEGWESFADELDEDLTEVDLTLTNHPPSGFAITLPTD